MNYFLLFLVIAGVSMQSIMQKTYNLKVNGGIYTFAAGSAAAAMLVFIITGGSNLHFTADTLLWSVAFAAAYTVSFVANMLAIRVGPLSLSSLIVSCSLIIPTLSGLLFLKEPMSEWLLVGLLLLLIALVLVNVERKTAERKITLKWGFFILLAFIGNGALSTVQKFQQHASGGLYKSELMICALLITVVVMSIFSVVTERKEILPCLKKGLPYFAVCGIANGVVNFLVLLLSNRMNASVMFPVISAGGVVMAALVAIFLYKEKLQPQQWIGIAVGTLAIIALNL